MEKPGVLIALAGLPGVGKTTVARAAARLLPAAFLRIDTLEHALAESGLAKLHEIGPAGYQAAAALAVDNLLLGMKVIADSVNPWPLTRKLWRDAADSAGAKFLGVELVCSDKDAHRQRVETRDTGLSGFVPPTWRQVVERNYQPWLDADVRIDTAVESVDQAAARIVAAVRLL